MDKKLLNKLDFSEGQLWLILIVLTIRYKHTQLPW